MALSVMIVDDALFMRNMLKDIFPRAGYDVVGEAEDGEAALERYRGEADSDTRALIDGLLREEFAREG